MDLNLIVCVPEGTCMMYQEGNLLIYVHKGM